MECEFVPLPLDRLESLMELKRFRHPVQSSPKPEGYRGWLASRNTMASQDSSTRDIRGRLGLFVDAPFRLGDDSKAVYSGPVALGFVRFAASVGSHFDEFVLIARRTGCSSAAPYKLPSGVALEPLPDYGSLRRLGRLALAMPATIVGCWRALSAVDIVWVSGVQPVGLLLVFLARLRRREVVLLIRQDTMEYFRNRLPSTRWRPLLVPLWLLDRAFRWLARRLPTTVVGAEIARRYGAPRPNLLEFQVSLSSELRLKAAGERREWSGTVELLTVGRLEPEKNPLLVPELLAELERRRPGGYRLTWAGEGRLHERLVDQARAEGVEGRLRLAGFVPHGPELDELYRSAHAFVHTALTEGVPQVLGEAAAAGVPIVATDVGGVSEALDGGVAGLLVPPGDAAAIAEALERLRADPALRETLTERGLELVENGGLGEQAERVAGFVANRGVASRPPLALSAQRGDLNGVNADVSVLIPVFNEDRVLRETAAAMLRQRFEGEIEFLFIDGRSTDETGTILESLRRQDPRVRLLDNPDRLQGAGLNLGLRAARGEFVVRMDAHAFYPPDYVALGVQRLRRGDVAWVAGPQISEGTDRWSNRVAMAMRSPLGVGGARFRSMPESEIETDSGFTGVWRRRIVVEHGGWDEGATPNEDGELAARIRAQGGRIVCLPQMAARSLTRGSLRALARQYWRYGMYRARTLIDYPRTLRPSQLLPPALVVAIPAALIAPDTVAWLARLALALYALGILIESVRVGQVEGSRDPLGPFLVFPTMHLSWGAGLLVGTARFASGRRRRKRERERPL